MPADTIPALSIWQPWASALAHGVKQYETRHWSTAYRGPLLIHAAKKKPPCSRPDDYIFDFITKPELRGVFSPPEWSDEELPPSAVLGIKSRRIWRYLYELPRGVILGVATLADCLPVTMRNRVGTLCLPLNKRQDLSLQETMLGDFSPGRFGWQLANVRLLPEPVPYRGAQGLFRVRIADVPGLAELLATGDGKNSNHRDTENTEGEAGNA